MLYRNRICMLMSQNFKLMQGGHMKGIMQGEDISVLMPLSQMFTQNHDMMYQFAAEAYKAFISAGLCKESDFVDCYEQLAIYGVFLSNFVFCYNCKTGKLDLYTSSYSLLTHLASRGILMGKRKPIAEEMKSLEDALVKGARISTSIKKGGLIQAVRLDWEYRDSKLIFTPTIPRSQLNIRDEYMIPYTAMDQAMRVINDELQTKVLKVTSGDKVRVVTKNPAILNMVYGEVRTNSLLSYTFDARSNSFFVPCVGASIYSSGVTNLDLTAIDKIQPVSSLAEIDLSEVQVDVSSAPSYCESELRNLTDDQLIDFGNRLEITGVSSDRPTNEALISEVVYAINPYKLYCIIKECPYFSVKDMASRPSKWGSAVNARQVEIPSSVEELDKLFKTGIFKVTLLTRDGKYKPVVVTNSYKELKRIYGNDYYSRFESEGNRLRMLSRELKSKYPQTIDSEELSKLCNKWGTPDIHYVVMNKYPDSEVYAYKDVYQAIVVALHSVDERKTVVKQPGVITVRSCDCKPDTNATWGYYKNISLRAIKSILQITNVEE